MQLQSFTMNHLKFKMYYTSMLPSKVMPYLLRLAAPLTDSSIVQMTTSKGKNLIFVFNYYCMNYDVNTE